MIIACQALYSWDRHIVYEETNDNRASNQCSFKGCLSQSILHLRKKPRLLLGVLPTRGLFTCQVTQGKSTKLSGRMPLTD